MLPELRWGSVENRIKAGADLAGYFSQKSNCLKSYWEQEFD